MATYSLLATGFTPGTVAGPISSTATGGSGAVNTTGATLLIAFAGVAGGAIPAISDSAGNSWGSPIAGNDVGANKVAIWAVKAPTTSASHVFTLLASSPNPIGSLTVLAFSGDVPTTLVDFITTGSAASGTTATTGSITPSASNDLVMAFITSSGTSFAISGGLTIARNYPGESGVAYSSAVAYVVQTAAATVAPTWTWTSSSSATTTMVALRSAATPGPTLTASANTAITATTATGNVSTDNATGTLYTAVTTSATPPTVAAIQAGTGFVFAANQAISSIGAKTFSVTGLSASTVYYEYYQQKNGAAVDSVVVAGPSFTTLAAAGGPALTSPTGTSTGSTTASGTVSTDTANGTLYRLASINAAETAATIKAAALSQTVTATGVQNVTFTGLTASTVYYAHYVHTNASAVDSAVANSPSFTTAAASATIAGEAIKNNTGTLQATVTIPKVAFIRLSDMVNVLTLTNQVTNASGLLSISNAALASGVAYLRVLSDATGANVGIAAYTAV